MNAARASLRAATRGEHERVDALFARFDLADRGDYGRLLCAHAAALAGIEEALDAAGMARLLPDWEARRRSPLLRADLAVLGLDVPAPLPAPPLPDDAAAWGAAYVLEGSRLGGMVLAQAIAPGLPHAYFAGSQPKGAWRAFLAGLDAALTTEDRLADATAAARATFALFELAGLRQAEHVDG